MLPNQTKLNQVRAPGQYCYKQFAMADIHLFAVDVDLYFFLSSLLPSGRRQLIMLIA